MKFATDVLERFTALPPDPRELRLLLDDVGLEVKRMDLSEGPVVFNLELLANRGDHHCYDGVAREVAGRTGLPMCGPEIAELSVGSPGCWPLANDSDDLLLYSVTLLIRNGPPRALSTESLRPLEAAGIHSITPAVDATNLSNHELGQPTHVFDADKVVGTIRVRYSRADEPAWLLFADAPTALPEGLLVIADDEKVLAVAGVIGCEDSKATADSQRILVESACFDPVAVRKAGRAIDTHTDSSARFEKGADPQRVLTGAGRVVHLLEGAGWAREGSTAMVGDWSNPERTLTITAEGTNGFLETSLVAEEISDILLRYGFLVDIDGDALAVQVPTWRLWDVEESADLYEEVARALSYSSLPTTLPPVDLGAQPSPAERRQAMVDQVLVGAGFYEVFTDGFYGRQVRELLGLTESDELWDHVQTTNALDRAFSFLKNNCVAQAVTAVADNLAQRSPDIKMYEWTRTFHPEPHPEVPDRTQPPCSERQVLWMICNGADLSPTWAGNTRPADAIFLKGILHELSVELGLEFTLNHLDPTHPLAPVLHRGRAAAIELDGLVVGVLGEIHPGILQRARIKRDRPVYLQLRRAALIAPGSRPVFDEPPSLQPLERNLAFGLPDGVEAGAVAAWLHASGPDGLDRVTITDRFDYEEDGRPFRSITFALRFDGATDSSSDAVNATLAGLADAVVQQFGAVGVRQR